MQIQKNFCPIVYNAPDSGQACCAGMKHQSFLGARFDAALMFYLPSSASKHTY